MNPRWRPPPMNMHPPNNFGPLPMPFCPPHMQSSFPPPPRFQQPWGPPPNNSWQTGPPFTSWNNETPSNTWNSMNSWNNGPSPNTWNTPPPSERKFQKKNNSNTKRQRKEPVFVDFCDVCDRGFKNDVKKAEHYRQHVKCDEPGCQYEAHFKIVAIHKENLHGPNALKIKLDTPEDVQRWRNERKRKYPTLGNIEKKVKQNAEQQEYGNVLGNKYFGKMHRQKQKAPKDQNHDTNRATPNLIGPPVKPLNLLFTTADVASDDANSSDEEGSEPMVTTAESSHSLGLGSLMQNYASSSEEEGEVKDSDENKITNQELHPASSQVSKAGQNPNSNRAIISPKKRNFNNETRNHSVKRKSLLEMLLAPDIRRERNHILQCVRFIVKNNFFDEKLPG